MRASARALVFPLFCALAAIACADDTIVLATIPAVDSGGPANLPVRCVSSNDCTATNTYCDKDSCGAPAGTCEFFPPSCDNAESLVCGCDGVTYFNDCLRQAAGVAPTAKGACTHENALLCGLGIAATCPTDTVCARLLGFEVGPQCPHDAPGTCWRLPPECPSPSDSSDLWDECADNGAQCVETCTAIRSGNVAQRPNQCPPPPSPTPP